MAAVDAIETQVLKILDEIQKPKSLEKLLHPSELKNYKKIRSTRGKISKDNADIFIFVNDYHAYCKICSQHFYSETMPNDINSYFQNHMNSVDHKNCKLLDNHPEDKPIFEWEKWLYTGCCNICNESDVEAYIILKKLSLFALIELHCRGARHADKYDDYQSSVRTPRQLLKKLSSNKLFVEKCIGRINNKDVCLLCCKYLEGKKTVIHYHVNSDDHCKLFEKVIIRQMGFSLPDLLNCFNLEEFIRKAVLKNAKVQLAKEIYDNEIDSDYLTDTDYETEKERIIYEGLRSSDTGFSPKSVEEILDVYSEDFIIGKTCTLCEELFSNAADHLTSNSHELRMMLFKEYTSSQLSKYHIYSINRTKRLEVHQPNIEKYNNLKKILQDQNLDYGVPYKKEYDNLTLVVKEEKIIPEVAKNETMIPEAGGKEALNPVVKKKNVIPLISKEEKSTTSEIMVCGAEETNNHVVGKRHKENSKKHVTPSDRQFILNMIDSEVKNLNDIIDDAHQDWTLCKVCKLKLAKPDLKQHLLHKSHLDEVAFLLKLKALKVDDGVIDSIQCLSKNLYACLVCYTTLGVNSILSHLSGKAHNLAYKALKTSNSAFVNLTDYKIDMKNVICVCLTCGVEVYSPKTVTSRIHRRIQAMMNNIKFHGVCNKKNGLIDSKGRDEVQNDSTGKPHILYELQNIYENNKIIVTKNKNIAERKSMLVPCVKCSVPFPQDKMDIHLSKCSRNETVDLSEISNKLEEILNLFQNEITENISRKLNVGDSKSGNSSRTISESTATSSRHCSESSDSPTSSQHTIINGIASGQNRSTKSSKDILRKEDEEGEEDEEDDEKNEDDLVDDSFEASKVNHFFCFLCRSRGSVNTIAAHLGSEKHVLILNRIKGEIRVVKCSTCGEVMIGVAEMLKNHDKSRFHRAFENAKLRRRCAVVDVLMVTGEHDFCEKAGLIFNLMKKFGTVKHIKLEKKSALFEFEEPEALEKALKRPLLLNGKPLTLKITKDKGKSKFYLHTKMITLLSNPTELTKHAMLLKQNADSLLESSYARKLEKQVCTTLCNALSGIYPNCFAHPFGSRFSGLTLEDSDFDIFLDCGSLYQGLEKQEPRDQKNIVVLVAKALKRNSECTDIVSIPRARVPIISFFHRPTSLHCDVSFKNGLSCVNSLLIKFLVSLDPRVKPFILFLKDWVDLHNLHGPPAFSSYAVTMLAIFYLQQLPMPILPTIEYLQKLFNGPRLTIGGWDCSFSMDTTKIPGTTNKDSLEKLLFGFFDYYSKFKYSEYVISPLTGLPLSRLSIENMMKDGLPMPYKRQMYNIPIDSFAHKSISICIMDPFDLSHNLTKSFPRLGLKDFIYLCDASCKLLRVAFNKS